MEGLLQQEYMDFYKKLGGKPIPDEVMEKYRREMHEANQAYLKEARIRAAKTAELANKIFIC